MGSTTSYVFRFRAENDDEAIRLATEFVGGKGCRVYCREQLVKGVPAGYSPSVETLIYPKRGPVDVE